MERELNQTDKDVLESMIDRTDLAAILRALSEICCLKGQHLGIACRDLDAAKTWWTAQCALHILSTSEKIGNVCL